MPLPLLQALPGWWTSGSVSMFPLTYNLVVPPCPPTTSQMRSRPLPPSLRSRRRLWWSPGWCQKRRNRGKLRSWRSMLTWQTKRNILSGVSAPFPEAWAKSLCWFTVSSGKLPIPLYSLIFSFEMAVICSPRWAWGMMLEWLILDLHFLRHNLYVPENFSVKQIMPEWTTVTVFSENML